MTLRIAIGGFPHESHSFAPLPTSYRDFVQPGGFPPLCHGPALLDSLTGRSVPAAGAIRAKGIHAPTPSAPRGRGFPEKTCWSSDSSWLHPVWEMEPPANPGRFTRGRGKIETPKPP
jgi:Metallopeptidase family M81